MKSSKNIFLIYLILYSTLIHCNLSFAQTDTVEQSNLEALPTQASILKEEESKLQNLKSILNSISQAKRELKQKQKQLSTEAGRGREEELTNQIKSLANEIGKLERNFIAISGEVDPQILAINQESEEIEWGKELKELLAPLLDEVKRLSSRPRENARLKTKIEEYSSQLNSINLATTAISNLKEKSSDESLIKQLNSSLNWWKEEETEITANLKIAQTKLKSNLKERQSFFKSVRTISELFFKSRGRNLIIAILSALIFWVAIRQAYLLFHNRADRSKKSRNFYQRLFNVIYLFLNGAGTALVFFGILFFFEDWVLLTIALLIGLGVIWTSKEALPRFWDQAMLLLNLGGIREGERVIYNNIPFKVHSINFFSVLVNPNLDGGRLRLPLKDLTELRSRTMRSDEIWFPTNKLDWVLLNDETFGQIVAQSTEAVVLELKGGARKTYLTSDFVSTRPIVLSNGFRVESTFGIDYKHQEQGTNIIPETLEKNLRKKIAELGYSEQLQRLEVEFALADSSSLNLLVLADFKGAIASEYQILKRLVQKIAVESASENGWNIPFPQLSVHMEQVTPCK